MIHAKTIKYISQFCFPVALFLPDCARSDYWHVPFVIRPATLPTRAFSVVKINFTISKVTQPFHHVADWMLTIGCHSLSANINIVSERQHLWSLIVAYKFSFVKSLTSSNLVACWSSAPLKVAGECTHQLVTSVMHIPNLENKTRHFYTRGDFLNIRHSRWRTFNAHNHPGPNHRMDDNIYRHTRFLNFIYQEFLKWLVVKTRYVWGALYGAKWRVSFWSYTPRLVAR